MPAVPAWLVQSETLSPGCPSLCSSPPEGQGLWGLQPRRHELHQQTLTIPREEVAASFGSDGLEPQEGRPLMADLMADPNAPLTKAFIMQLWMALPDSGLAFGPEP